MVSCLQALPPSPNTGVSMQSEVFHQSRQLTTNADILKQVATLQPGYIGTPFDWPLHVRCDDPKQKCPCGTTSPTLAYTVNTADGDAYINFCQRYFDAPTLSDKISEMKNAPDYEKFDIDSYRITKGAIWYHELTHWDRGAQRNDFTHVTDYTIQYLEKTRGGNTWTRVTRPVYGGLPTKILAKWNLSPGQYVSTSADNLALYAVAKYVQKQIGRYPDLPVLPLSTRPEGDPTRGTALVSQGDNGVVQISVGDDVLLPDGVDCGVEQTEVLKVDSFFDQSSYPADYVANHEKRVAELMGGGGGDVGASCEGKAKASDCRNLDWGSGSLDVAIDLSQSGNGQTCYQDGNARWCDVVTAGSCQATVLWDGTANGGSLPAVTRQELKAWVDAHVGSDSCTAASEKVSGICALKPGPALCTTEKTLCVKGYGYGCP